MDLTQLNDLNRALKASNGVLRSVSSYDSLDAPTLDRRAVEARPPSRIPSNPFSSRRRPVSPISIPSSYPHVRRTRSSIGSTEAPVHRDSTQTRRPTSLSTQPAGLATPETESIHFQLGDNAVLRRRLQPRRSTRNVTTRFLGAENGDKSQLVQSASPENANAPLRSHQARGADIERTPISGRHVSADRDIPGGQGTHLSSEDEGNGGNLPVFNPEPAMSVPLVHSVSSSSSVTAENMFDSQDACLPSPSLSPITAMNTHAAASLFDSLDDQGADTDSSFENHRVGVSHGLELVEPLPQSCRLPLQQPRSDNNNTEMSTASLMNYPAWFDFFRAVPDEMKPWIVFQILKECPKSTLHIVADVVNPALKCDFFSRLPRELTLNIVKYFDVQSMCLAAQVSKRWRHIINSDEKAWKELFDRDGFTLPEGELQRAIQEGWGWQFPNGKDNHERDLHPIMANADVDVPAAECSAIGGLSDRTTLSSCSRRPKRKAATRVSSRKPAKRRISSGYSEMSEASEWIRDAAALEAPYAAATAAAAAVPYPMVGLPSLRSLHLYKSLYQRHYSIAKNWMRPGIKPRHIAFRAHDRHVVTCLQFDTDKILTGSDDTNINVYDTKTGALRATLEGHEGGVWALEYYGNTLVSGSTDRSVRVWDIERARCTQIFQGHTSTVRCLQILLPTEIGTNADGTPEIMPKEPLIITGSRDSNLRVWKLPKLGDPVYYQAGPHAHDTDCPYFVRVLTGHQHSVRAIAAHGDTLVSGSYDFTVRVWKISTGETIHRLQGHTLKVYSVVLDHKRNRCISGSMDNMVKVWSLDTGTLLYNLEGHTSLVGLLDLQSDRLVSAAADSTLRIWDPENGQCKSTLTAHTGAITCFQHDGQKVVSGSDRTLKMWDVRTGECVKDLLTNLSGVWQVRFNDRRCVAAVQRDHLTYIEVSLNPLRTPSFPVPPLL
jgi:F-box and WD-40 domain protein CDC4